ncbi:undecaprenyl-diphosphatase [Bacillus sp. 1P06AnD]|uniref:undecaprenyl-diphosphatase n=1 Tax=Bacillus sp. 1P06AnD TaxID=3132208 RepID=UPI0039A38613
MDANIHMFRMVNDLGKDYTFLNPIFVFIAQYTVYLLGLAVVIYFFSKPAKNKIMVVSIAFSLVLAEILAKIVGLFHTNNQPFAELAHVNKLIEKTVDNSFPSDHTILFFTVCFSFFFFGKKGRWLWVIAAFCVGISRIWVGVHYPFDVIVGALLGILSSYIGYRVIPRLKIVRKIWPSPYKATATDKSRTRNI